LVRGLKMIYLTIDKTANGYRIKDSINNKFILFYGYTLRKAERVYRQMYNLKRKQLERIFI